MIFTEPQHRRSSRRGINRRAAAAAVAITLALTLALATSNASGLFIVNQPWVYPAGKAASTHAYMNVTSTDGATLVGARSDDARRVLLHSAAHGAVSDLTLPAQSEVALAPGRDYLVLIGLKRTLKAGERVKLILSVRDGSGAINEIEVNADVRIHSPIDDERRAHHHH